MPNLTAEIKDAVAATALGQPLGPALVRDVGTAVRGVLARHGLYDAEVRVRRAGTALEIEVIPPPRAPHVQRIRLTMG